MQNLDLGASFQRGWQMGQTIDEDRRKEELLAMQKEQQALQMQQLRNSIAEQERTTQRRNEYQDLLANPPASSTAIANSLEAQPREKVPYEGPFRPYSPEYYDDIGTGTDPKANRNILAQAAGIPASEMSKAPSVEESQRESLRQRSDIIKRYPEYAQQTNAAFEPEDKRIAIDKEAQKLEGEYKAMLSLAKSLGMPDDQLQAVTALKESGHIPPALISTMYAQLMTNTNDRAKGAELASALFQYAPKIQADAQSLMTPIMQNFSKLPLKERIKQKDLMLKDIDGTYKDVLAEYQAELLAKGYSTSTVTALIGQLDTDHKQQIANANKSIDQGIQMAELQEKQRHARALEAAAKEKASTKTTGLSIFNDEDKVRKTVNDTVLRNMIPMTVVSEVEKKTGISMQGADGKTDLTKVYEQLPMDKREELRRLSSFMTQTLRETNYQIDPESAFKVAYEAVRKENQLRFNQQKEQENQRKQQDFMNTEGAAAIPATPVAPTMPRVPQR